MKIRACCWLLLGLVLTAAAPAPPPAAPRLVVLGTAQDGGFPHTGCEHSLCAAARKNPGLARQASGRTFLIDATPDLPEQIRKVHAFRPHPEGKVDRAPFDGVFLTHAHLGHYLGLAHFGFESLNANALPVWASPRMAEYLRANGPWSQLVRLKNIELREIRPGERVSLEEGVTVSAFPVPHRDEYSDTMAFVIRGPHSTVLYVPDTDGWATWTRPLPRFLEEEKVDVALLDATFYSPDELPDRDVTKIRHPLVTDTMELLGPQVKAGKLRVFFTHLNHSNPALDPESPARKAIAAKGFAVLEDGAEIGL
jgi:pyrroloquinoline quinone biosynthesis protein B